MKVSKIKYIKYISIFLFVCIHAKKERENKVKDTETALSYLKT